ncbi:MAG: glutathione S-transferase family protein [Betaproteobacteria bacterium]|nr:glutathione S-transferase family protein [Betaproteobacteria bacterium]
MLKLYDRELSGNAYKARLLLALLDVPYQRIPVAMKEGRNLVDSAYAGLNPRGQIPTLVDGEDVLWGSTAILCYLALRHDPAGSWLPRDPLPMGRVMQWLELAQNEILGGLFRARGIVKFGLPGDLPAAQATAVSALEVLESRLRGDRWLAGPEPTIADIACFPYVALAWEGGVEIASYAGVRRWVGDVQSLPGFVGMPGIEGQSVG